jgi:hypothetical protein
MTVQGIDERGGIAATTAAGNGMSIRHDMDKAYAAYPPVEKFVVIARIVRVLSSRFH